MKIGTKTILAIGIVLTGFVVSVALRDPIAGIVVMLFVVPVAAS